MNKDTNRLFSWIEWRVFVAEMHKEYYGIEPTGVEVIDRAKFIYNVQRTIPRGRFGSNL